MPYGWTLTDLLLTDLFHAISGEPHPSRPKPKNGVASTRARELADRLRAQRERLSKMQTQED